jgi:hypothetical protein
MRSLERAPIARTGLWPHVPVPLMLIRQGRWSARSVMAVEFNGYLVTPVRNNGAMAPGEMVGGGDRLV